MMGDHMVLYVDRLVTPAETAGQVMAAVVSEPSRRCCGAGEVDPLVGGKEEEEPLIGAAECRICQEDDSVKNMDVPCACSGSLKYAHKACLQQWVNAKGDLTCEICHEPYKPGYYVPPRVHPDETIIDFSGGWTMSDANLDLHDPWLFSTATAQRHFLEAEYDDYEAIDTTGRAYCRSAALILMAFLLVRHALSLYDGDGSEEAADILSIFMLRAAGLLLPCYALAWFISSIQRRRQRETAQPRSLHFTVAPQSLATPRQELE